MSKKESAIEKTEPLWSAAFIIVIVVSLFGNMNGTGLQNGIMVIVDQMGGPTVFAGALSSIFSVAALITRFVSGRFSDKYGRRKIIMTGGILLTVSCLIGLLSPNMYLLIAIRILMGVGFALVTTTAVAAVADVVPPSRLGEAMGYQGFANALSLAIGPFAALLLAQHTGRIGMWAVFLVLGVLVIVMTAFCSFKSKASELAAEEARKAAEEAARKAAEEPQTGSAVSRFLVKFVEPKAFRVGLVNIFSAMGVCIFMVFIAPYAAAFDLGYVSVYFLIGAAVMFLIRLVGAKWVDRYPVNALVIPSMAVGIIALVFMILVHQPWTLLVAGVLFGITNGLIVPTMTAEAMRKSPANRRGAASSTYWLSYDIAIAVASILWGATIDAWGITVTWILAACSFAIAIVLALIVLREKPQK